MKENETVNKTNKNAIFLYHVCKNFFKEQKDMF